MIVFWILLYIVKLDSRTFLSFWKQPWSQRFSFFCGRENKKKKKPSRRSKRAREHRNKKFSRSSLRNLAAQIWLRNRKEKVCGTRDLKTECWFLAGSLVNYNAQGIQQACWKKWVNKFTIGSMLKIRCTVNFHLADTPLLRTGAKFPTEITKKCMEPGWNPL